MQKTVPYANHPERMRGYKKSQGSRATTPAATDREGVPETPNATTSALPTTSNGHAVGTESVVSERAPMQSLAVPGNGNGTASSVDPELGMEEEEDDAEVPQMNLTMTIVLLAVVTVVRTRSLFIVVRRFTIHRYPCIRIFVRLVRRGDGGMAGRLD